MNKNLEFKMSDRHIVIVDENLDSEILPQKQIIQKKTKCRCGGHEIFVCDDDYFNIFTLSSLIQSYGLDCDSSTDPIDCLSKINKTC
jgi:hypothetical protein